MNDVVSHRASKDRQVLCQEMGSSNDAAPIKHVRLDVSYLLCCVAQTTQSTSKGAVYDGEVAASDELLELDQSEIRFNARGIAIHHE